MLFLAHPTRVFASAAGKVSDHFQAITLQLLCVDQMPLARSSRRKYRGTGISRDIVARRAKESGSKKRGTSKMSRKSICPSRCRISSSRIEQQNAVPVPNDFQK